MSDGIEFGDVQHQKPDRALRPDLDPRFSVHAVGEIVDGEMPIFVDLDVMRDMEGHAQTNTNVELGGVMLGFQYHDENDQPFVLVTDCLRAEHYEATKGSFKFTHETWQTIARQRDQYPEEIQMVGWYHTHPDWGVFLSGMDLFICNNFFNRPLDIALVIDPCRGDRGWFYWDFDRPDQTERTGGFYLYASRFRSDEIGYFAGLYQGEFTMASDPRYNPMSTPGGHSVVNIHDQRTPIQNIAIMGMLTIQMLVLALIAWKLLSPGDKDSENLAKIEESISGMNENRLADVRSKATLEVLDAVLAKDGGEEKLASKLAASELERKRLELSEEAHFAHRAELRSSNRTLSASRDNYKKDKNSLQKQVTKLEQEKKDLANSKGARTPYWLLGVGAALFAAFGAVGGYAFKYYLGSEDEFDSMDESPANPNEHPPGDEPSANEDDGIEFGGVNEPEPDKDGA